MPLDKLVPGVTGIFGPTLKPEKISCVCQFVQCKKCKYIVLKNEIHFDYVKVHGFNGNTLCGVKNEVYILQYSYFSDNLSWNTKF